MSSLRAFTRSYMVVLPDYPLLGHRNQGYNYIHVTILTQTKHMPCPLKHVYHVFVSNQGLLPILQAIYLQSGCESFQTDRKYIRALSTREFDGPGYEPTSYSKFNKEFDTMSSQFHSRQGKVPYLEDLLLRHAYDRLTPAVTTDKEKIYTHCSTYTTLLTGSGDDLQLISRVPPWSLKHTETSCSLQHIDRSTICSSHAPLRTDDSYPLQSYVLPRLRAH
ncbi:hypothetical protein F2Q69_00037729 [Brassica cretica]|uniref:Uncharacterized protein n=1 Tax=Brassica cretica TaxID=69181 RepID=A0A8S9SK12_BRACR|nr:hypothetical protein F2Q69_00037729 [Brassica cretica]